MDQLKNMLLGIAILLFTIILHLFIESGLTTDFIAIIGIVFVVCGYLPKGGDNSTNDQQRKE